jgi:PAS domain S-box-containing protein
MVSERMSTPLRVLILEDSEDDSLLLVQELKRGGFAPTHERVDSAAAMQDALASRPWDLILADYSMPAFSALDALKLLHDMGLDLPFIIVSGTITEATAVDALKAGAHDFVVKGNFARLVPAIQCELREVEMRAVRRSEQAAQRELEASFRLMFVNNPLPMWVYDRQTLQFLEVNHTAIVQYGYSREEFLALRITDIRAQEDVPWLLDYLHQNRSELRQKAPSRHQRKGGQIIDVEVSSHNLEFAGRPAVLVLAQDVSERKQAEDDLRDSEARFRSYFELGLIGMAITSPTKGILEVNDQICEILGYSRSELLQTSWSALTHPEDLAADAEQFDRVLAGEIDSYSLDKRWLHKDGRIIDTSISVKCLRRADGTVDYFVALMQDITAQKQAGADLRESEEHFRQLAEHIREVFWLSDTQRGTMLYISPAYEDVWGRSRQSLYDDPRSFAEAVFPEDRQQVIVSLEQQASGQETEREYRIVLPSQELRWVHDRGFPIRDETGRVYRVAGIAEDITRRKQSQELLQRQFDRLATLRAIDQAITSSMDLHVTLGVVLETVMTQLHADAADVLLLDRHTSTLYYAAGRGFQTSDLRHVRVGVGEGTPGRSCRSGRWCRLTWPMRRQHSNAPARWSGSVSPNIWACH